MTQGAEATIPTDDGPMPTYAAAPAGTAKGGVVVIQEAFGVTDHIKEVTRRFAGEGWHAIAPALFHRQGSPVLPYGDIDKVRPVMQTLTAGGITTDLLASIDRLEAAGIPAGRIAIVGFCMGGTVAYYGATLRRIGAAVTFYGAGVAEGRFGLPALIDLAPSLATPWLGLFGDLDTGIPVDDVERLRRSAAQSKVDSDVIRYPDAGHGFHCDSRPDAFETTAAADAWRRTLAWMELHAVDSPASR